MLFHPVEPPLMRSPDPGRSAARDSDPPDSFPTEADLDEFLTRPRPVLVEFMRTLAGPLVVLGAGGKMGPTLAVLARRAADQARAPLAITAVSRFSNQAARSWLESRGVRTISSDLLDRRCLTELPEAAAVVYLVGLKFGTSRNPSLTWAVNTLVPAHIGERYARSRIVALSTGNVYPLVPAEGSGAGEDHPLTPLGEYGNAAIARERLFEHFAGLHATPLALVRLNYALDLRYGVLADLARHVAAGDPVNLGNGRFNGIWQGDANEFILRALALAGTPPTVWNLTGLESWRVREVAIRLGELLGRAPVFEGLESSTALLSDARRLSQELGPPPTPLDAVLRWTAAWVREGGRDLGKPTHFEVRDGRY